MPTTDTAVRPATPFQKDYARRLLVATSLAPQPGDCWTWESWAEAVDTVIGAISFEQASKLIGERKTMPRTRPLAKPGTPTLEALALEFPTKEKPASSLLPEVPEGRYAVQVDGEWTLWKVCTRKDGKSQYVLAWTAVSETYVPAAQQIIPLIAADPKEAAAQFGHRTGVCGVCGRELSDPESVARGIGPVCWKKW